ncbi:MAG TPA: hypothetical protein VI670_20270 [Thermoanaerobaculia bacterium]
MLIQAMPIYNILPYNTTPKVLGCYGTTSPAPSIHYSITGPNMKFALNGSVPAGGCGSVNLDDFSPPFSISLGQSSIQGAKANNISSRNAIVTYGYLGAKPANVGKAIGAFVIVRVP